MAVFEVVLVSRTPVISSSPTLTVVNRLVVDTISYTDELNRPGTATLSCPVAGLATDVKARLVDMAALPSEVWNYADSTLVWAGEVQTLNIQGQSVQLGCIGLLGYTFRMGVTADTTFTAVDQFTIAKTLVDNQQAQNYGNYGIDTSTVGTSGVTRNRTYLRNELHNVGQRITELGAVIDGFDLKVDPSTRKLVLASPTQGTDLSSSVFVDQRNIDSASIAVSIAPDDLVSDVSATGSSIATDGGSTTLYSARSTSAVQTAYGRSWSGQSFTGVSVQATLDGAGDAYLGSRNGQLFQPGVTIIPLVGCNVGDFHAGDTINYSYDAGLGLQTSNRRVSKLTVSVDDSGKQRLLVEFI
jgi:hypothetical protein